MIELKKRMFDYNDFDSQYVVSDEVGNFIWHSPRFVEEKSRFSRKGEEGKCTGEKGEKGGIKNQAIQTNFR